MHDEKKIEEIEEIEEKYCMQIHDGTQDVMFPEQYRLAMKQYAEHIRKQTIEEVRPYLICASCENLHHTKKDQHKLFEKCPVEEKITKILNELE